MRVSFPDSFSALFSRTYRCNLAALVALCVLQGLLTSAAAQGNLLITPGRIVFEGQKNFQELNLANTGSDTARYAVSFMEIKMKEDGTFEQITQPDSGQQFASPYLRLFPRNVVLAPNEAQSVKVQLKRNNSLPAGEYRSHLYFRAVPAEMPLGETAPETPADGISVKLTPLFGISIPVIVRVGETTSDLSITNLSLSLKEEQQPRLYMSFNRTGNASVYGDIQVDHIALNGKTTPVALINGVAVYTPVTSRRLNILLDTRQGIDYRRGKLRVTYTFKPDTTPSRQVQAELPL
jgi:P pilus assembly chaperone PapD